MSTTSAYMLIMIRLEEHLELIKQVQREILLAKKGTSHYRDLCRRYKKLCRERAECLRYLEKG